MSQFLMSMTAEVGDIVTEMPFTDVLLKSALAYASIFVVTGVIIGVIWLLGKVTNKK